MESRTRPTDGLLLDQVIVVALPWVKRSPWAATPIDRHQARKEKKALGLQRVSERLSGNVSDLAQTGFKLPDSFHRHTGPECQCLTGPSEHRPSSGALLRG